MCIRDRVQGFDNGGNVQLPGSVGSIVQMLDTINELPQIVVKGIQSKFSPKTPINPIQEVPVIMPNGEPGFAIYENGELKGYTSSPSSKPMIKDRSRQVDEIASEVRPPVNVSSTSFSDFVRGLVGAGKGTSDAVREFEEAKDKVMMGVQRKSMVLTDEEKETTAYHEAGHAIVAIRTEGADPVHKVTIIPRGRALGVTMQLPMDEKHGYSKPYVDGRLAILMGGRAAEMLIFDKMTTGAGNDIEQATQIARKMVTEWGMSEKLGFLAYGADQQEVFLGHSVTQTKNLSDATAKSIDEETRRIIDDAYRDASKILSDNKNELETLARGLLEYETLSGDEIQSIINGDSLSRNKPADENARAEKGRSSVPAGGLDIGGSDLEPVPQLGD